MSSFHKRKADRKEYYERFINGWKLRDCIACAGSGYYDHNGSPRCGACGGSGKERYKPIESNKQTGLRHPLLPETSGLTKLEEFAEDALAELERRQ